MQKEKKYYESLIKSERDYKQMLINFLEAFFFGGILCLIGQIIYVVLLKNFSEADSTFYLLVIAMSFASILSAIGIYDDLGQIAKCGLAIPITGFANACVSSAMEYKKEGLVLGIASNCLKLAGSVIVLGSVSAIVVNTLRYIFEVLL